MQAQEIVAARPVRAAQPGTVWGGTVVGLATLVLLLVVGRPSLSSAVTTVVAAIVYGVAWGGGMGLLTRRQWRRMPPPPLADRVEPPGGSPILRGLATSALLAVVTAGVLLAMQRLLGTDLEESRTLLGFVPGGLFGLALATVVGAGELERWQEAHGLDVWTRGGRPRISWTQAQARDRLVAVPRSPDTP